MVGALHLAFVLQFELAGDRRQRGVDVADARHDHLLVVANRAALGVRNHIFHRRDRQPLAHARALVDLLVFARGEGHALDHLLHIVRQMQRMPVAPRPRFLRGDRDAFFHGRRIVRANLRADAVFQRRDDLAARRVVFRIRAEHQRDIERQADRISLNLHVAFLHDVEQADLNLSRQIGQFVDGEDAAIGARQQAVVHGQFAREFVSAARRLDGIDVADQVGDGDVGRGQLLHVALIGREIGDRRVVAQPRNFVAAAPADRRVRIVVNFAAREIRHVRIEQRRQRAQDAALRLTAQPQQNEIVARKNGVDDLRHDRVVVADDAGKHRSVAVCAQPGRQVVAQFILDAARAQTLFGKDTAAQFTQCARKTTHERNPHKQTFPDYTRRGDGAFQPLIARRGTDAKT